MSGKRLASLLLLCVAAVLAGVAQGKYLRPDDPVPLVDMGLDEGPDAPAAAVWATQSLLIVSVNGQRPKNLPKPLIAAIGLRLPPGRHEIALNVVEKPRGRITITLDAVAGHTYRIWQYREIGKAAEFGIEDLGPGKSCSATRGNQFTGPIVFC